MNNSSLDVATGDRVRFQLDVWAYIEAVALSVICFVSLTGNISLFIVVFRNKALQKRSNWFTLNLACADILVSSVSMPITVFTILSGEWHLGHVVCVAMGFLTILSFIASVLSLALIAINRYFYIVHWRNYSRYFKKSRIIVFIASDWALSIVLSSPPLLGWSKFDFIAGKSYCFVYWPADIYFMYFMIFVCFFGPLVTMVVCYTRILIFTRNARRKVLGEITPTQPTNVTTANSTKTKHTGSWAYRNMSREESKITNTLLIVLAVFLLCWAPFAITMFFDVYHPNPLSRTVDMGSLLLGYVNSMCNPIIYAVRNRYFKVGFVKLYSMCFPCLKTTLAGEQQSIGDSSIVQRPAVLMHIDKSIARRRVEPCYLELTNRDVKIVRDSEVFEITEFEIARLDCTS